MTEISYKGADCVVVQTKQTTVITDPMIHGAKTTKALQKATVQLLTQPHFASEVVEGQKVFFLPGEYEIGDISVKGIPAQAQLDNNGKNATVYRIKSADCVIAVLGHVNANAFKDEQFEALGIVDILIIPIGGGGYTIDAHDAVALTRHIDPRIVVPVHYAEDDVNYEVAQDSIEQFTKELSAPAQKEAVLKIKQPGQLPEVLTLIQLEKTA